MRFGGSYEETIHIHRIDDKGGSDWFRRWKCTDSGIGAGSGKRKKLVSKDEYDKSVIAATLTPGALPVEIASGIGLHVGGIGGMLAGGVLMALPGVVFTVLYLMLLSGADSNILQQIQYASIGITAFILCLLTQYIVQTLKSYRHSKFRVAAWFVILFVFIATGGNYLCRILD